MPHQTLKSIVQLDQVTYTHWNQNEPTLKDLSMELEKGTLTILVGRGGSGKSTICNLLNGVIPHLYGGTFEGEVLVDGENTRIMQVRDLARKVGCVFQDPETMLTNLYVEDEIAFGPECLCLPVDEIRERVGHLLQLTDLEMHRSNLVWNLSGGQVQKLGLAAALAMNPKVIALDEPTANLDPVATRSVHELVLSLRDQGITVLLVTREIDELLALANVIKVVEAGRIITTGSPEMVLREHGDYLVNSLGVWLPETVEISVALRSRFPQWGERIPISVEDTLQHLESAGLLRKGIIGEGIADQQESSGEVLVSARDLRFTYPDGTQALKGISLDIRAGEMLAIVGRNGAGKSTLAKLFVGLLKPQAGDLNLFGKPYQRWHVRALANEIALVFQNPEHQFLTDCVADEIGYSLMARGVTDPSQVRKATDEMLHLLGLENVPQVHPFAINAGLKRRLGVATMLVGEPRILLVDEPTYGQDKEMTRTLMSLMEEIRSKGITVVMITHDMRLVQEYAERVVVMSEGHILYDGPCGGLFDQTKLLLEANLRPTILHQLIRAIRANGTKVTDDIRRTTEFIEAVERANDSNLGAQGE